MTERLTIAFPAESGELGGTRRLNIALWVLQVFLAVVFLTTGLQKLLTPYAGFGRFQQLSPIPTKLNHFIGVAEICGALGLILPAATRIMPGLTPLAGFGVMVVMVLATGFHLIRAELNYAAVTMVLAMLAGFVTYGRFFKLTIASRSECDNRRSHNSWTSPRSQQ